MAKILIHDNNNDDDKVAELLINIYFDSYRSTIYNVSNSEIFRD